MKLVRHFSRQFKVVGSEITKVVVMELKEGKMLKCMNEGRAEIRISVWRCMGGNRYWAVELLPIEMPLYYCVKLLEFQYHRPFRRASQSQGGLREGGVNKSRRNTTSSMLPFF